MAERDVRRTRHVGHLAVAQSRLSHLPFRMNHNSDMHGNGGSHYLAVGEDDTWPTWPHVKPLKSLLMTTGEDRFLIVEYPDSHTYWAEPRY